MKQLLIFSATWCGPCKQLKKTLADSPPDVSTVQIDIDEQRELSVEKKIRSVPTLILEKDGIEIKRTTGNKTLAQLQEFIVI